MNEENQVKEYFIERSFSKDRDKIKAYEEKLKAEYKQTAQEKLPFNILSKSQIAAIREIEHQRLASKRAEKKRIRRDLEQQAHAQGKKMRWEKK